MSFEFPTSGYSSTTLSGTGDQYGSSLTGLTSSVNYGSNFGISDGLGAASAINGNGYSFAQQGSFQMNNGGYGAGNFGNSNFGETINYAQGSGKTSSAAAQGAINGGNQGSTYGFVNAGTQGNTASLNLGSGVSGEAGKTSSSAAGQVGPSGTAGTTAANAQTAKTPATAAASTHESANEAAGVRALEESANGTLS